MALTSEIVDAKVQATLERLEPRLQRSEADSRPVVFMTCGIAGQSRRSTTLPQHSGIYRFDPPSAGSGKSTLSKALMKRHPNYIRLSIDTIIASYHGIYGRDYPPSAYESYQAEADAIFLRTLESGLRDGSRDIVLDRSFYAKAHRGEVKQVVERLGGRLVLVFLEVGRDELWRRIMERRARGVSADSAREIGEEVLRDFVEGFEVPDGEGEFVVEDQNVEAE